MNKRSVVMTGLVGLSLLLGGCAPHAVNKRPPLFKEAYGNARHEVAAGSVPDTVDPEPGQAQPAEAAASRIQIVQVPNFSSRQAVSLVPFGREGGGDSSTLDLPSKGLVQVSVEGVPVADFVNLVFGQLLDLNYSVSPKIDKLKEKITLNMTSKMVPSDFFYFVTDLLERYQIQVQETHGALYIEHVRSKAKKPAAPFRVHVGRAVPDLSPREQITQIVPIYYMNPNQMRSVLKGFLLGKEDIQLQTLLYPEALMVIGSIDNIKNVVGLISMLDKPAIADKSIDLVSFEYINVSDFTAKLGEILPGMDIPLAGKGGQVGLRLIPVEQLNALLVVSPRPEWLDAVVYWQRKIDTIEALGDEKRLFVFQAQNRPAEELVEVLEALMQKSPAAAGRVGAAAGQTPAAVAAPLHSVSLSAAFNEVGVSLDKGRNAIVLMAYPSEYKNIRAILQQLDTPPRQVLTEVTIAEVTLTDQLDLGLELFFKNRSSDYASEFGSLDGLGLAGAGFNYLLSKTDGDFQALFNAFAKDDLINIISTPHLVVLDGHEASINVGTDVPIVTSETSASDLGEFSGSSILRNVQYRSTGVSLSVKPVVNSDGTLTIELQQELSEAQANNVSDIDSPVVLNRKIKTTLSLRSGETVLLGGLISENKSTSQNKIPFLGDIPFLGRLFRVDSEGNTKTELIIQITPYILNDQRELKMISDEFTDGWSGLDAY